MSKKKMQIAYGILLFFCLAFVFIMAITNSKAVAVEFKEDVIGQGDFQCNTNVGTINKATVQDAKIAYGHLVKFDPGGGDSQSFYGLNFSGRSGSWLASSSKHYLRAWDCSILNATANIIEVNQSDENGEFGDSTLFIAKGFGNFREKILDSGGKYGRPIELHDMSAKGSFRIKSSTQSGNLTGD